MIGPVHFANNQFADSSTDPKGPKWQGLSPLGKALIKEANRLGMIIDASHASDASTRQMIELSKTPIVLSHSGANAIYDHPRNVPDDILLMLKETGGVIQMNAFGSYLTKLPENPERSKAMAALRAEAQAAGEMTDAQQAEFRKKMQAINQQYPAPLASFDSYMAHFLHVLKLIGPDHVGVSGDFDGGGGVEDFYDIAAFPDLTERLLAEGYSKEDLAKIWGDNLVRLLEQAEAHAASLKAASKKEE
jgi:membrane dipeptidase